MICWTVNIRFVNALFDTCIIKEKRLFDNEEYEQTFAMGEMPNDVRQAPEEEDMVYNILIYILQLTTRYSRIGHADNEKHKI